MDNVPMRPVHSKETIYDVNIRKTVRVFLNGGGQLMGVLHEIDLDKAVLNPSLINYSMPMTDECRVEPRDTPIPYHFIAGMQDIEPSYLERMCKDIDELNRINRKKREVERMELDEKLRKIEVSCGLNQNY